MRGRRPLGLTLMELMVVLVTIGLLAVAVTARLMDRGERAKNVSRAKADISNLGTQVKLFKADNSRYPAALIDLVTKPSYAKEWPEGGYIEKLSKDPWDRDYVLLVPGDHESEFDVISYGADGRNCGEGLDADLHFFQSSGE